MKRENYWTIARWQKLSRKKYFSPSHATFDWLRKTFQNKNIKNIRFVVSCIGAEYEDVRAMLLLLDWNYNILETLSKMPVDLSMFGKLVG